MKNFSKIFSISILIISIIFFLTVFYKSEIYWNGSNFSHYLQYYVISIFFFISSVISFYIPDKFKITVLFLLITVLLVLFSLEGILVIKEKNQTNLVFEKRTKSFEEKNNKKYDKRTRLQVYKDLKKEIPDIAVTMNPFNYIKKSNLKVFPLSGISDVPTINCNENGYYSIYKSDRYGFNNPDSEWDKELIDFLIVGDSFSHGSCVNETFDIAGQLRKLNSNKNGVLSLAYNSNGPLIEWATLREYLPNLKVKNIIWQYYPNDFSNLSLEILDPILSQYLNNKDFSQNLINKKDIINDIVTSELNSIYKSKISKKDSNTYFIQLKSIKSFLKLSKFRKYLLPTIIKNEEKNTFPEFKKLFADVKSFAEKNNAKLYFVYLPDYNAVINNGIEKNFNFVHNAIQDLDVTFINLTERLKEHEKPTSLYPSGLPGHYNEVGYMLVASEIFNLINNK